MPMDETLGKAPVLDTLRIARRRFGRGGNGLEKLSRRLGIQPVSAHRALADAKTTGLVFQELLSTVGGWDLTLADAFLHQGGAMHLQLSTKSRVLRAPAQAAQAMEIEG